MESSLRNYRMILAVAAVAAAFVVTLTFRALREPGAGAAVADERPERIVSMAPSITEVLFAVGAGSQVAGVTRYCDYPPEARELPHVGGYLDPSYESIMALEPDLVVILVEQEGSVGRMFRDLNLPVLVVDHRDLAGILESIDTIGRAAGRDDRADVLLDSLSARMDTLRSRVRDRGRPGVLVVLGRNLSAGDLGETYIAGSDGYYNDLVKLAGGRNSYTGRTIAFPAVSAEGLMQLDPDVIIEVIPNLGETGIDRARFERAWRDIPGLEAAERGDVHVFVEDYAVRPGPRFIELAERMARAIHPEAGWPGEADR